MSQRCKFSLKPFSKGLAEPPSAAVARRNERNSPIGVFFRSFLLRLRLQKKAANALKEIKYRAFSFLHKAF